MTIQPLRRPWHAVVAVSGALLGAVCFLIMHLAMTDVVDPFQQPVSSYALTSPGSALFALGTMAVALSCAVLARVGLGLRDEALLRGSLAGAAVLLVLVVLFRTDTGDSVTSAAGQIHRFAAGGAFVLLACSGWMAWRRLAGTDQHAAVAVGVLTLLGFGALVLTGLNTFMPDLAGGGQWRGLPQRALLAIQTGLVVVLGLWVGHTSQGGGRYAAGGMVAAGVPGRTSGVGTAAGVDSTKV